MTNINKSNNSTPKTKNNKTNSSTNKTKNKKTNSSKQNKEKVPFTTKVKTKVDNLTIKQIFYISFLWLIGLALWFYFNKDKEKSKVSFKGTLFGILILFGIGMLWGVISCLIKM